MASVVVVPNIVFPYGFIISMHTCGFFSYDTVSYNGMPQGMCISCEWNGRVTYNKYLNI